MVHYDGSTWLLTVPRDTCNKEKGAAWMKSIEWAAGHWSEFTCRTMPLEGAVRSRTYGAPESGGVQILQCMIWPWCRMYTEPCWKWVWPVSSESCDDTLSPVLGSSLTVPGVAICVGSSSAPSTILLLMASRSHLNNFTRAGCFPKPSTLACVTLLIVVHWNGFTVLISCPCHLRLACSCRFRQLVTSCKKRWSAHRLSFYCSSNRLDSYSVSWCGGGGVATGNTSSVFSTEYDGGKNDKHTKLSLTILRTGVTTNIHFLKYNY